MLTGALQVMINMAVVTAKKTQFVKFRKIMLLLFTQDRMIFKTLSFETMLFSSMSQS